jgi:DUF4097 and DUF4098 domain-containing protein YvlB
VQVRAEISDGLRKTGESRQVVGDTLQLHSTCPNFGSDWCNVNYDVTIPRDLTVVINSDNGQVAVRGTTQPVTIDNDNGSVEIADVSGPLNVTTDNGRISGSQLRAATVTADTDNGRILLEFAVAPTTVVATGDNGRIEVVVPNDGTAYRVNVQSDNGSETVEVPTDPSSARTITIRTDNGAATARTD